MVINVAIDGPAGAGKSTIAKAAAKALGFCYIDTGAMYRALGLAVVRAGKETSDPEAVAGVLENIDLDISYSGGTQHIFLNGEDVSEEIRKPEISIAASNVSAHGSVRAALVKIQRKMAQSENVIMDGRDICMYVLPDAQVKIYLTASVDSRAMRRFKELTEKGQRLELEDVKADMEKRDYADMHRKNSPLCVAPDAKVIDTSNMSLEDSVEAVISYIKERTENAL